MDMIINKLPSPTWRWLKVNQSALTADISSESEIVFNRPEGVAYSEIKESELENIATGIGEEFGRLVNLSKLPVHRFSVSKDTEVAEILRLDFSFNKADCSAGIIELDIAVGAAGERPNGEEECSAGGKDARAPSGRRRSPSCSCPRRPGGGRLRRGINQGKTCRQGFTAYHSGSENGGGFYFRQRPGKHQQ